MNVITLKLERRQRQRLKDLARASGRSQAAVVRDLIDEHHGTEGRSLHDRASDLCGSINAPRNLSTRPLADCRRGRCR